MANLSISYRVCYSDNIAGLNTLHSYTNTTYNTIQYHFTFLNLNLVAHDWLYYKFDIMESCVAVAFSLKKSAQLNDLTAVISC